MTSSSRKGLAGAENPEVDGEDLIGVTGVCVTSGDCPPTSGCGEEVRLLWPHHTARRLGSYPDSFWYHPAQSQVAALGATEDPVNPLNEKPVL